MPSKTPFQQIEYVKSPEKESIKTTTVIDGKHWALVKYATGNKSDFYNWDGKSFTMDIHTGTGLVVGDNKWLLFTTDNNALDKVIELKHLHDVGTGQKKWETKEPETKAILDNWKNDGCLVALLCNGVPQLELLAEHSQGLLFGYPGLIVDPAKKDFDEGAIKTLVSHQLENSELPELETDEGSICESQNTLIALYFSPDELKILAPGRKYIAMPVVPNKGLDNLPKIEVIFSPPDVKGGSKGNYSGKSGGGEVTPKDRETAVFQHFNVTSFTDLMTKVGLSGDPIAQLNVSLALAGCKFGLVQATQTITETVYPDNIVPVLSGKYEGSVVYEKSDIITDIITEPESEPTEDENVNEMISLWLNDKPKFMPDNFDYKSKSVEWKALFYQCLISTINGKPIYENQSKLKVKKLVGKYLYDLDEDGLQQVLDELIDPASL